MSDLEHRLSDRWESVDRVLDLGVADDRAVLASLGHNLPELRRLVGGHLDDYLPWFTAAEWSQVYSGGFVSGPKPADDRPIQGYSLVELLRLSERLARMQHYDGFQS